LWSYGKNFPQQGFDQFWNSLFPMTPKSTWLHGEMRLKSFEVDQTYTTQNTQRRRYLL
jgi:hypothetical protein